MSERSALIVGPGSAFGFELARDLYNDGYEVGVIGSNVARLTEISQHLLEHGIAHYPAVADVRSDTQLEDAIERLSDRLPPWRVAIYNVKESPPGDALALNPSKFKESLDSNVVGVLRLGNLLVQHWQRTESAVYILSGGGYKDNPDPNKVALSVGKGALHTLATAIRPAYATRGIAVKEVIIDGKVDNENGISPNLVSQRYVRLSKSKRDTIVIDEKSQQR